MKIFSIASLIFSAVFIFASISSVESTWLLNRRCNGTTIEGWGTYLTGSCYSLWGSTNYGSCSGTEYTEYNCRGSPTCSTCKVGIVQAMSECNKNLYLTCSSGAPDYSVYGSSYGTLQFYMEKDCPGDPYYIAASSINQCHNSVIYSSSNPYQSVYISCSKDGSATLNLYQSTGCQQLGQSVNIPTNTCTMHPSFPLPFIATCTGF